MAWIRTVPEREAKGRLKAHYDVAVKRAGKVWNIVSLMSPNPEVLEASIALYLAVMKGASPLSRKRREMIAVVVSALNGCHY